MGSREKPGIIAQNFGNSGRTVPPLFVGISILRWLAGRSSRSRRRGILLLGDQTPHNLGSFHLVVLLWPRHCREGAQALWGVLEGVDGGISQFVLDPGTGIRILLNV